MPETTQYGPLERHQIDIYRARGANAAPAPVLFFVYGGGWTDGRRSLYRFLGNAYAAKGFTVAIPDYRLYPEVRFPGFVDDAALAFAWVKENIAAHGGDPGRIHLMGHSAGAHTGALLSLDESYLGAHGFDPSHIKSFTGVSGPYSFNPLNYDSVKPIFEHLDDVNRARPIKHARAGGPPMLLLHSKTDTTVHVRNSDYLQEAITEAGGTAHRITYPMVGHIAIIASIAAPIRFLAPVLSDSVAFMRQNDQS